MFPNSIGKYVAVIAVLLTFNGAALARHTAEHAIKIGAFLSLTGTASFLGEPAHNTLELYIDKLNAEGGVLGRELQLIHYDVGDSAEKAQTFVKRLIEVDQVDILIGGSTTGTTLAVIPWVEQAGIPFISLAGSQAIIDPVKRWVFKTPPTDRMAASQIFTDLRARGIRKIALISGADGFGVSGRQQAKALAEDYGIEIVADEIYTLNSTDKLAQLIRIQTTAGVQAVLNFGTGLGPALVTKNYRQLGLPWPLYQSHGVASLAYLKLAGAAAEGVRLPAGPLLVAEHLAAADPQKPLVTGYRNAYRWCYDQPASSFGGYALDALLLAVDAITRAGTTEREAVRQALEETHHYVGVSGVFTLSPSDHLGLGPEALQMLEIRHGEFIALDRVENNQDKYFAKTNTLPTINQESVKLSLSKE